MPKGKSGFTWFLFRQHWPNLTQSSGQWILQPKWQHNLTGHDYPSKALTLTWRLAQWMLTLDMDSSNWLSMDDRPHFYTCYSERLDPTSWAQVCYSHYHTELYIVEGFENIPIITMGINPAIEIHSFWNPDSSIPKQDIRI